MLLFGRDFRSGDGERGRSVCGLNICAALLRVVIVIKDAMNECEVNFNAHIEYARADFRPK